MTTVKFILQEYIKNNSFISFALIAPRSRRLDMSTISLLRQGPTLPCLFFQHLFRFRWWLRCNDFDAFKLLEVR